MNGIHKFGDRADRRHPDSGGGAWAGAYRKDLHTYLWGWALALALTLIPFALVHWHALTKAWLLITVGVFAFVQAVVHFRCFLHVNPPHEHGDELLLVLFTAVILVMLTGGTVWILGDLHARMY